MKYQAASTKKVGKKDYTTCSCAPQKIHPFLIPCPLTVKTKMGLHDGGVYDHKRLRLGRMEIFHHFFPFEPANKLHMDLPALIEPRYFVNEHLSFGQLHH